jgi:hypothetical protein
MCESELKQKYEAFARGSTMLESSLHLNLTEHVNSEIGLGTITDTSSAREWLRHSFLIHRVPKNTGRYLGESGNWESGMDTMLSQCISDLKRDALVNETTDDSLTSTDYGDIMSKVRLVRVLSICVVISPTVLYTPSDYGATAWPSGPPHSSWSCASQSLLFSFSFSSAPYSLR